MTLLAALLVACVLAWGNAHANAQAGATPPIAEHNETAQAAAPSVSSPAQPPTADDVCRTLEQAAAENALPVEFFARVIWQESRFNASAVSPKGAEGIAQFMPRTADWHGLADPFNPIDALRHSAGYLRELRERFGNLGLAAAAYNAGPGRVSAWLASHHPLPSETRNYVAIVTGWTADEWASPSPPQNAETTIPQGVPCTRLANLILAPKDEGQRIATYVPRWGVRLAADLSESKAWAIYRERLKRFASLIGDREPIVLHKPIPGMGRAKRYIITIADDNRTPLDKLCQKLIALDATCDVLRNALGPE
jgi:Transglycosylase SLT domain